MDRRVKMTITASLILVASSLIAISVALRSRSGFPEEIYRTMDRSAGIDLVEVASGFDRPLLVVSSADERDRTYVVEQTGCVKVIERDEVRPQCFIDVRDKMVLASYEEGLLGFAMHPHYASNGRAFVYYTAADSLHNVVEEYRTNDGLTARARRVLLRIPYKAPAHHGGHLEFGPDGFLYVGVGDGQWPGLTGLEAQDLTVHLGKILRIDVDTGDPYAVPPDNPFVGMPHASPEIWAVGLRNPWRFSWDVPTRTLWVGDVGHRDQEEINVVRRGANYGWPLEEGTGWSPSIHLKAIGLRGEGLPDYENRPRVTGLIRYVRCLFRSRTPPVLSYRHTDSGLLQGKSVTGGLVYRGKDILGLTGQYVFGDYVSGRIWAMTTGGDTEPIVTLLHDTNLAISSFGKTAEGELLVCAHSRGKIYKIVPSAAGMHPD